MKKNVPLLMIFLVVFIDLLGFGILMPILPTYAVGHLKTSESAIGIIIATYSFVQFLFNPFFGSMSDKYGRRKIILFTLLVNAMGYVIFALFENFPMLLFSRVIAGIGGSSLGVAQAYISDVTTKEDRAKGMGMIGVAFGLGFVFGPVMGGILSKWGYMVVGLGSASFSLLAWLMSFFFLPETERKIDTENKPARKLFDIKAFKKVFSTPAVAVVIIMFFIVTFSMANIYGTYALLGKKVYHFTDKTNGYLFGVMGLVGIIMQGGAIRQLSKKFNDTQLISMGAVCMVIGLSSLPFGGNFVGMLLATAILSCGSGILTPILLSLVSKIAPEAEQGMVLGTNQSMSSFARMLGPLWGGFAFQFIGYEAPFLTGGIMVFFLFLFSVLYLHKHIQHV
jgi:MFS transporter, DHA1 family, tetracycline resistance protein